MQHQKWLIKSHFYFVIWTHLGSKCPSSCWVLLLADIKSCSGYWAFDDSSLKDFQPGKLVMQWNPTLSSTYRCWLSTTIHPPALSIILMDFWLSLILEKQTPEFAAALHSELVSFPGGVFCPKITPCCRHNAKLNPTTHVPLLLHLVTQNRKLKTNIA